ncbi:GDSL-like lipase/acylhydrolase family protein [Nitzschia inconspicua]|uniref:GDSL-like lipase/acylhydrolase family protein n=1 Tax=Nitzschia inconspicua TaxID=303405 RepID=A0A9K3M597_9STRA|nr:GDSL-like lipase/acylhydrolase family protein [Nitzschia inconspicua]
MYVRRPIVLFGDSLTQFAFGEADVKVGWASLLCSAYQRRVDVLNRGFSGYNTRHALDLVPKLFTRESYDDVMPVFSTVFLGANDACLPGERQHVPKEEYAENLTQIIRSIRESSKTKGDEDFPIIVITPPPVDSETWRRELGLYEYFDRTNEIAREYGQAAKEVAKDTNCHCLDTWQLLNGSSLETYRQHLSDGLHLSESGNRLLFEGLMALIEAEFPHLAPSKFVDGEYAKDGLQMEEALWSDLC